MGREVEVVVLFGPPFAGKTLYYQHNLKSSHSRISAAELFKEDPSLSLRQVILKIVSLLKNGTSTVIDDENWSRSTRLSYIKLISAKVPSCKFRCLCFKPDGHLVLRWFREWYLAKSALNGDNPPLDELSQREARIARWFQSHTSSKGPELLDAHEGFNLQDVNVKLTAEVEYKFEVPALFIQQEGIVQMDNNRTNHFVEATKDILKTWISSNPWGRLIVISDASRLSVRHLQEILSELSQSVSSPIYFYHFQDSKHSPFAKPPQPGLIAFLQRFHNLNLWHRGTLYLTHSEDHADCARSVGMKVLKAASCLKSPQLVYLNQCTSVDNLPSSVLRNIKLVAPFGTDRQRSAPTIPLYLKAINSEECGWFVQELNCGRTVGICYKDKETLERYQDLYAESATRVTDPGTKMATRIPDSSSSDKPGSSSDSVTHKNIQSETKKSDTKQTKRGLPSWLVMQGTGTKKKAHWSVGDQLLDSSGLEEPLRKKKTDAPSPLSSTIYCMSPVELYETALLVLQEKNKHLDESLESNQNVTSSSQETKTSVFKTALTSDLEEAEDLSPTSEIAESPEASGAQLVDDIFLITPQAIKPPPRKAKVPPQSHKSPGSSSALPECFAPETLSCVPETAGYSAASIGAKKSTIISVGKSSQNPNDELRKAKDVPDLSFLDDIF